MRRAALRLGLAAGALLYAPALLSAQVTSPTTSEVPLPVKPATDTTPDSLKVKKDTVKPPIARFRDPAVIDGTAVSAWNRDQLFASGAFTLGDLLDHVPEVTVIRSGWISTPQVAGYNGDARRVRVFYDDIEFDDLNPRDQGALDLSTIQIWTLESVTLERAPSELRIYVRSWRVEHVTPYTRTDVSTGNESTNLYRGYYGKRFDHGQILQVAGQQYGVSSTHSSGSGDQLSLLARIGVGGANWSIDAYANRTHPVRSTQVPFFAGHPAIPPFSSTQTLAYLRAGLGRSDSGLWLQAMMSSLKLKETSPHTSGTGTLAKTSSGVTVPADTADTTRSEHQINVTGGLTSGPLRLTLQDRIRALDRVSTNSPSGHFELVGGNNVLSAFAERDAFRKLTTYDASAHVQPLSFIAFTAGAGRRSSSVTPAAEATSTAFRANASLRMHRLWLSGGVITADTLVRAAPVVFDTSLKSFTALRSTGVTGAIRGPVWRGIGVDSWVTHWSNTGAYQPRYQSRFELNFASDFLDRFPKGDFGVKVAAAMEYRSRVTFLAAGDTVGATSSKVLGAILEIRILRGILTYQQRNAFGYQYDQVPGYQMPRVLAIYGIRWEFWN